MSDLDELANAAHQAPIVRPTRVSYVPTPPRPPKPPKQRSPFAWGFGVALGVVAAFVLIVVVLLVYGQIRAQQRIDAAKAEAEAARVEEQETANHDAEASQQRLAVVSNSINVRFGHDASGVDQLIVRNTSSQLITNLRGDLGGSVVYVGTVPAGSQRSVSVSPMLVGLPFHLIDGVAH